MIYLYLTLSLGVNGVLIWYVRKLLGRYWSDISLRNDFIDMLEQYTTSLEQLYKLEEYYGEEPIKKAILQTRTIVQATKEFKEALGDTEDEDGGPEFTEEEARPTKEDRIIRLREGESISQDAASYKRVIPEI
jgi:hypothetical protein